MKKDTLRDLENTIFVSKYMLKVLNTGSMASMNKSLHRWIKDGEILKLKNGYYITKDTYNRYISTDGFLELIANKLRTPSYVSLEYALSKYGILTEAVYTITSVSLKTGRSFENETGKYIYRNIKAELFIGYIEKPFLDNYYNIATKEKALFDYIYFKYPTLPKDISNINIAEELRLNLKEFSKKELNQLRKYAKLSKVSRVINIVENIIEYASNRE